MITKKASQKQTIVLILGILFVLNEITTGIYGYVHNAPLDYIISTSVQYACMAAAMILAAFRKKTPALVLVIAAMILCLVNQFILVCTGKHVGIHLLQLCDGDNAVVGDAVVTVELSTVRRDDVPFGLLA